MARVEVEETELRALHSVGRIVQKLMSNPTSRRKVLELQKEVMPDVEIAELTMTQPVYDEMAALKTEIHGLKSKLESDATERTVAEQRRTLTDKWNRGRNKLREQGWNEDGLTAVEKFMEDEGIASHEVAAAAYEKMNPNGTMTRPGGNPNFDIFDPANRASGTDLEMLFNGDDEGFLRTVVPKALQSARSR